MLGRCMLAAALLLATGLAGCIGGQDEGTLEAASLNESEFNQAAPDGSKLVAFEETNATEEGVGGLDHHHDMWQGRTRVVIFEQEAAMDPLPGERGTSATFRPVQGSLIYEATQQVEFTISDPERRACYPLLTLGGDYVCTDGGVTFRDVTVPEVERPADPTGGPTGLKLRYKHASTTTWVDVGELKWGVPLPILVTDPRQTDMPHATSSLWEFQVVSPHPEDATLVFKAKAELVRGDADIPLWPGHPDFYADGKTSREVLNVPGAEACDQAGCSLASGEVEPLFAQRLVSYGTRSLHVWVNITDAQFPNPATAPQNWFLFHRNATGRENITNPFDADSPIDKREFYWIFPVDDNGMDSPYADGSRWNFELGGSLTTPALSCYGNCADWYAKYDIVIHASSIALDSEAYTYHCLRDEECP